ncbi:MAG: hypothetical protein M3Y56_10870 [Armatimonadota bacterium]|nr:hypothetical protein [Armatimonadota bacterium]
MPATPNQFPLLLDTLPQELRQRFNDRPVLREALLEVVAEISERIGDITNTSNVVELNRRMLPLLERAANLQGDLPPADPVEQLGLNKE